MQLAERLDDYGKPAWIAVMILSFIIFWPIGLGILAYMIWSGRMGCWKSGGPGRWHNTSAKGQRHAQWRGRGPWKASSGNRAFDEYREQTLQRLEDEQREFTDFLERLRMARDKEEFERFMDERRRNAETSDATDATEVRKDDEGPAPQPAA